MFHCVTHCHVGFRGWSCEGGANSGDVFVPKNLVDKNIRGGPLPTASRVITPVTHLASAMHRGPITPFISSRGLPCLCVLFVDGNLRDFCFLFDVLDVTWLI